MRLRSSLCEKKTEIYKWHVEDGKAAQAREPSENTAGSSRWKALRTPSACMHDGVTEGNSEVVQSVAAEAECVFNAGAGACMLTKSELMHMT